MGTGMGGDIYIHIYTGALHKSSPSSRIRSTGGTPTRLAAFSWACTCVYYAYIDDFKKQEEQLQLEKITPAESSVQSSSLPSQMRAFGRPELLNHTVHTSGRPGSPCRHFSPSQSHVFHSFRVFSAIRAVTATLADGDEEAPVCAAPQCDRRLTRQGHQGVRVA